MWLSRVYRSKPEWDKLFTFIAYYFPISHNFPRNEKTHVFKTKRSKFNLWRQKNFRDEVDIQQVLTFIFKKLSFCLHRLNFDIFALATQSFSFLTKLLETVKTLRETYLAKALNHKLQNGRANPLSYPNNKVFNTKLYKWNCASMTSEGNFNDF